MSDTRKTVPREPTEAMRQAGLEAMFDEGGDLKRRELFKIVRTGWRAMYDAAPVGIAGSTGAAATTQGGTEEGALCAACADRKICGMLGRCARAAAERRHELYDPPAAQQEAREMTSEQRQCVEATAAHLDLLADRAKRLGDESAVLSLRRAAIMLYKLAERGEAGK